MELKLKPHLKSIFPLSAILIKNSSAAFCLKEIQQLQWSLDQVTIYPVPGLIANSVWGFMVIPSAELNLQDHGRQERLQMVSANLFIPENSVIHPIIAKSEIDRLLPSSVYLFHPEVGLAELKATLVLEIMIQHPEIKLYQVTAPHESVFIPKEIISLQIQAVSPEEAIKNLEENVFPKNERLEDNPLNLLEKSRLFFYQIIFNKSDAEDDIIANLHLPSLLGGLVNSIFKKEGEWATKMRDDFGDLDKRNQNSMEKLMDLLKKNPDEALKYAIPLDPNGSSRGGQKGTFELSKRWSDFSLQGNSQHRGSGHVDMGDQFFQLRVQYQETAKNLIAQGDHQKAAFVYMKLLKDNLSAAQALESGKYFQEAASIYLKHLDNKKKAAECYEQGNMTMDAIELYKEMNEDEKVGDLYLSIHKRKEADYHFEKVIEKFKSHRQYVKAALIYKNKMSNKEAGQSMLLDGWRNNRDAYNCLNNYFSNIEDIKTLQQEITNIYQTEVRPANRESFLQILRHEYHKNDELSDSIKDIAYEIIAAHISIDHSIISELNEFDKTDRHLFKDTMRFKINNNVKKL